MTFAEYFMPHNRDLSLRWFGHIVDKNEGVRILALCFMAAISEAEGQ